MLGSRTLGVPQGLGESPGPRRRKPAPLRRRDFRQIQSDPEDAADPDGPDARRKLFTRRQPPPPVANLSRSVGRLDGIRQVARLAQYEQFFDTLFQDPRDLDHDRFQYARNAAKQALKRGQVESDLERIQDLFPNDCLKLYEKDALTMKMKGLMRKRSGGGRLTRALSAKSLRAESPPPPPSRSPATPTSRRFLLDAPVTFSQGGTEQERHLFLFSDLLLVGKARGAGSFKLKESVRVSELWLARSPARPDTAFVLGWPVVNHLVTFTTQAARDLWWSKLTEVVNTEKAKEPRSTNIQVTYVDPNTNVEYCKTLAVRAEDTARGCVKMAAEQLGPDPGGGGLRLWAKTPRDEAPVPLVGHERPFAIKMSCLRDALAADEGFDLDRCNSLHDPVAKCHFILRSNSHIPESEKKPNKKSGRMNKIGHVLRRSLTGKEDVTGILFGLPLSKICEGDKPPRPLVAMLREVTAKGPFTQGIFRRSANARLVRELRERLDCGGAVAWDQVPVLVTAAMLKDLLRSLPDPLLTSALYPHWAAAMDLPNSHQRVTALKAVFDQLPKPNQWVATQVISALAAIARRAQDNLMSAGNLAVCCGPSLLWSASPAHDLRVVPPLVEALVVHAHALIGPPPTTPAPIDARDSGTDESDSLRRDDSSIESLECSPPPRKDKISLSRDSGLTMSDSQLYTPDEEESGSTSSSGYDPAFDPHSKVTPSISVGGGEYVRVYGGWEERMNPNFERRAWFRQRWAAAAAPTRLKPQATPPRRSASEESLLEPPPTPPRRNRPPVDYSNTPTTPTSSTLHVYSLQSSVMKTAPATCEVISEPRRHQYREALYSNKSQCLNSDPLVARLADSDSSLSKGAEREEDSSTLSDDDGTPHVSRSNSRGHDVSLRHLPPVHVDSVHLRPARARERTCERTRERARELASRSRSLPPPLARRAPITTYYLGDSPFLVTTPFRDHESYV